MRRQEVSDNLLLCTTDTSLQRRSEEIEEVFLAGEQWFKEPVKPADAAAES